MGSSVEDTGWRNAMVRSEKIKEWRSEIRKLSSLTIVDTLNRKEWTDLMLFLRNEDVSGIEHLKLSTTQWDDISWWKLDETVDELKEGGLGIVLETGRFSELEKLEIYGVHSNFGLGSASLGAAFRKGQFSKLRVLYLCDSSMITWEAFDWSHVFDALVEAGIIIQLTSFYIRSTQLVLKRLGQELDPLLKSQCLTHLRHLTIVGPFEWTIVSNAIKSGRLPNIVSLVLENFKTCDANLAELVEAPGNLFSWLKNLTLRRINTLQVRPMVEAIMKLTKSELALEVLDLSASRLGEHAVIDLVKLVESGRLPQLQNLDLSENSGIQSDTVLAMLMKTIQGGHLPRLKKLGWRANNFGSDGARAVAQAYSKNEALTADIEVDWDCVRDRSLEFKVKEYKRRNARLVALRNKVQGEEFKVLVPLNSAKVFLCGYPEVGKTTIRRTLGKHLGLRTRLKWETRPKLFKEPRTKGIELSRIQDKNNTDLILWDLAGQEEFHVLHGTFLADLGFAGGKATAFVLVFKVPFEENVEAKLMYWLKFVASSSVKQVKRQVMIVLNCFDGKQCLESDRRYWMGLIGELAAKFIDMLQIHPDPFIIDVRVAASVQPLKDHLFHQARTLLQDVEVPKACSELLEDLKQWSEGEKKSRLPIFSWQAFEEGWKLNNAKDYPTKNLQVCASYLHEVGEIIYFGTQPGSGNKSIVVTDPEWFCKQVVGQLLLPKDMLEGGSSIKVSADGSISLIRFQAFFEHLLPDGTESDDVISILQQVGLCYRKGLDKIIIPALIRQDNYTALDWEGQGFHGVMGRCLATEDKDKCAIPGTLFRRLQVELAQDQNIGGCGDSDYRAGKSYSSFKLGYLLVLVQFDVDHSDPSDDRIDILVKSVLREDSTYVSLAKVNVIHEIIQKLESLCVLCCPGLRYDIKVIQPWNATERTPKMTERRLMSLTEIKSLVIKGRYYLSWKLNDDPVELKTLLSESEMKGVLRSAQREYDECKRETASLGLLTEDAVQQLEEFEQENGTNARGLDVEGPSTKYHSDDGVDVTNREILHEMRQQHQVTRKAVHDDGHLTRQYIEKSLQVLLLEIRNKHCVLVSHIQAQQEFSNEERTRSVPRYVFLSRRQGKSNRWITVKEAFNESFELHLLCEAHFDDGFLHEVEGQEGVHLTKPKEWLVKISPWLCRSLQVAIMVGKCIGNIYLPGVFSFIPDLDYLQNDGRGRQKRRVLQPP